MAAVSSWLQWLVSCPDDIIYLFVCLFYLYLLYVYVLMVKCMHLCEHMSAHIH